MQFRGTVKNRVSNSMQRAYTGVFIMFGSLLLAFLPAQVHSAQLHLETGIEYWPRIEIRDYAGSNLTPVDVVHRARPRLSLSTRGLKIFVSPQDVRHWGSEPSTIALNSPGIDFHEAYAEYATGGLRAKIGRQEIVYGGERILGALNWQPQGRSFNAMVLGLQRDQLTVDVFGVALSTRADATFASRVDGALAGGHATYTHAKGSLLSFLVLGEFTPSASKERVTLGPRLQWDWNGTFVETEAYGQFGNDKNLEYQAWLVAGYVGYKAEKWSIKAGSDVLSGDTNATDKKIQSFDTLFATNHKWYGHMDLFLTFTPTKNNTAGLGLVDANLGATTKLGDSLNTTLTAHYFATAANRKNVNRTLGYELDLDGAWKIHEFIKIAFGYALFLSGEGFADIGRTSQANNINHFAYIMPQFNLHHKSKLKTE